MKNPLMLFSRNSCQRRLQGKMRLRGVRVEETLGVLGKGEKMSCSAIKSAHKRQSREERKEEREVRF